MIADFAKKNFDLEINLPEEVEVLVKVGDTLNPGDEIAFFKEEIEEFDLSLALGVSSKTLGKCLLFSLGQKIDKGQRLAEKAGFWGKKVFVSPVAGVLDSLSERGILKIKTRNKGEKIKTPVKGTVEKIESRKVFIKAPVLACMGEWAIGSSDWAEFKIGPERKLGELADLEKQQGKKLLVFKGKISSALVYKAEALDIMGLVVGEVDRGLKCEDLALLSLGGEKGIISDSLWQALKKFEGRPARIASKQCLLMISY